MRSLEPVIRRDLERKFILLSGPRQVGKTHLAGTIIESLKGRYYNWDDSDDREAILKKSFVADGHVILDEVHKYERWKSLVKGVYDKHHERLKVIVTGSARLDVYRRGGDSLLGRHYLYRLHPFSIGEVLSPTKIPRPEDFREKYYEPPPHGAAEALESLTAFGGFPEPFLRADADEHRRWSVSRRALLMSQDIRDLTGIQMLGLVEHLMLLLPGRVGSVLSVNSLKEDLRVAYNTVTQWLEAFERLYVSYRLKPYTRVSGRELHKPAKLYLWDWSQVEALPARFENLVASHLLKATQMWTDLGMGDFSLHYLRDREHNEVDFCLLDKGKPWLLVECKLADEHVGESLYRYADRLAVPAVQVVAKTGLSTRRGMTGTVSADRFLAGLP